MRTIKHVFFVFFCEIVYFEMCGTEESKTTDQISMIETFSNNLIITTTKYGPVEELHIKIDLIDFHEKKKTSVIDLNGPFLLLMRGRYRINFLKPNRWYGLIFVSENTSGGMVNVNVDERLIRTPRTDNTLVNVGITVTQQEPGNGMNIADRTLTVKWSDNDTRYDLDGANTTVVLKCVDSDRRTEIRLSSNQTEVTKVFRIEVDYDIRDDSEMQRATAIATPKLCNMICWTVQLNAKSPGFKFKFTNDTVCWPLEIAEISVPTRNFKYYELVDNEVLIHTSYDEFGAAEDHNVEEAEVVITAIELAEYNEESSSFHVRYNVLNHSNVFTLSGLNANEWYGVCYLYNRTTPFPLSENKCFAVEILAENRTSVDEQPIIFEFNSEENLTQSVEEKKHGSSSEIPHRSSESPIIIKRNSLYRNSVITVFVDDPCGDEANFDEYYLSDSHPSAELQLEITDVLCGIDSRRPFCSKHKSGSNSLTSNCTTYLCYTTNVLKRNITFDLGKKCLDLRPFFPASGQIRSFQLCGMLCLLLLIKYLCDTQ
ncbi:hypothetical protein AB6A40_006373 [Gnathostoma spinigerum]|uniref:Uncharacterized protein n=1 Tax=Gnathostoma spinigerum TaxID=75299 RepID=A0ABD6EI74_9BILA